MLDGWFLFRIRIYRLVFSDLDLTGCSKDQDSALVFRIWMLKLLGFSGLGIFWFYWMLDAWFSLDLDLGSVLLDLDLETGFWGSGFF
jgi:hypothetical protein